MLEYLTLYEFLVAMLMAGVSLCAYLWAAASGLWREVEAPKYRVLEAEEEPRG